MKHQAGMKTCLLKTWKCLVRIHFLLSVPATLHLKRKKVIRLSRQGQLWSHGAAGVGWGNPPCPTQIARLAELILHWEGPMSAGPDSFTALGSYLLVQHPLPLQPQSSVMAQPRLNFLGQMVWILHTLNKCIYAETLCNAVTLYKVFFTRTHFPVYFIDNKFHCRKIENMNKQEKTRKYLLKKQT